MKKFKLYLLCFLACLFVLSAIYTYVDIILRTRNLQKTTLQMLRNQQTISDFEKIFTTNNIVYYNDIEESPGWIRSTYEAPITESQGVARFIYEGLPYLNIYVIYEKNSGEIIWYNHGKESITVRPNQSEVNRNMENKN